MRRSQQSSLLVLVLAASAAAAGEPQGVPHGLNSENFPASSVHVEGGGEMPRHAQQPKFKQIREEDIPEGSEVKTINDGDLLDLTEGKYDKKPKYSKAVTKMFDSVMTDDPEKISAALSSGIDINIKGPDGYTPLFQAVFSHRVNAVKLLLAKGADATKGNDRGFHPLDAGAFSGCDHCVHLLLKHGVNPRRIHADGYNALHRAIWGNDPGHTEIVRMLLEAGLSPTIPAFVPDKGYLEPMNMVDENDATKALLENWIDKEARAKKRAEKQRKKATAEEQDLQRAFGKKDEL